MPKAHILLQHWSVKAIAIASLCCLGIVTIFYATSRPFRHELNQLYDAAYFTVVATPQLNAIANQTKNLAYCHSNSRLQTLDVYTPKQATNPTPVVIYIHGGGWTTGDKINPIVARYGPDLIKNGLAVVSLNYRLAPQAIYPAQNQDIECALTYLTAHAAPLHLNAARLGLFGDSAGGQLAAMTALTSSHKSHIKAVVELYGVSDLWTQITRQPQPDRNAIHYLGNATNQKLALQASPLFSNLKDAPPFLLFHGFNDRIVPYTQSVVFAQALQRAGASATLVGVQNANHGFSSTSIPSTQVIQSRTTNFFIQTLLQPRQLQ